MIKNIAATMLLFAMVTMSVFAQRVAIVDVYNILENMPEYAKAQGEIDQLTAEWRQEIAQEEDKIKSMYNKYQSEQVLLSNEVKMEREDEIIAKEKEVREMNRRKFGADGDLFRRRQELISPIQDQVFTAIDEFAKLKGYDIIFDKSGSAGLLYTNEEFDKTEDIKKDLGIR